MGLLQWVTENPHTLSLYTYRSLTACGGAGEAETGHRSPMNAEVGRGRNGAGRGPTGSPPIGVTKPDAADFEVMEPLAATGSPLLRTAPDRRLLRTDHR
jgi:hypothetical protein